MPGLVVRPNDIQNLFRNSLVVAKLPSQPNGIEVVGLPIVALLKSVAA